MIQEAITREIISRNVTYKGIYNSREMFVPNSLILKYKLWYHLIRDVEIPDKLATDFAHQTFCKGSYTEYNNNFIVNKDGCLWKDLRLKS